MLRIVRAIALIVSTERENENKRCMDHPPTSDYDGTLSLYRVLSPPGTSFRPPARTADPFRPAATIAGRKPGWWHSKPVRKGKSIRLELALHMRDTADARYSSSGKQLPLRTYLACVVRTIFRHQSHPVIDCSYSSFKKTPNTFSKKKKTPTYLLKKQFWVTSYQ